jgi:hypothetical protein
MTYAKLAYAVDLNTLDKLVTFNPNIDPTEAENKIQTQGLRFILSDFKVGNLSDIANVKYADALGQYPDGQDIVHVSLSTLHHEDVGGASASTETATASWGPGPMGTPPDYTVERMMPIMQEESGLTSPLVHYCAYTVTVTLGGRSRTYKASFLFAANSDAVSGDVVVGIGGGALLHFITHPIEPSVFLDTTLFKNRAVRRFLESGQRTQSCVRGEVCCDPIALSCGISAVELGGRL